MQSCLRLLYQHTRAYNCFLSLCIFPFKHPSTRSYLYPTNAYELANASSSSLSTHSYTHTVVLIFTLIPVSFFLLPHTPSSLYSPIYSLILACSPSVWTAYGPPPVPPRSCSPLRSVRAPACARTRPSARPRAGPGSSPCSSPPEGATASRTWESKGECK